MQPPLPRGNVTEVSVQAWIYLGALIVMAIVGGLVIIAVRRRLLAKNSLESNETLMETLRRLRDSGEMSPGEYEASVRAIAQRISTRKASTPDPDPPPTPREPGAPPRRHPRSVSPSDPKSIPSPPMPPPPPTLISDFPPLIELPPEEPSP